MKNRFTTTAVCWLETSSCASSTFHYLSVVLRNRSFRDLRCCNFQAAGSFQISHLSGCNIFKNKSKSARAGSNAELFREWTGQTKPCYNLCYLLVFSLPTNTQASSKALFPMLLISTQIFSHFEAEKTNPNLVLHLKILSLYQIKRMELLSTKFQYKLLLSLHILHKKVKPWKMSPAPNPSESYLVSF